MKNLFLYLLLTFTILNLQSCYDNKSRQLKKFTSRLEHREFNKANKYIVKNDRKNLPLAKNFFSYYDITNTQIINDSNNSEKVCIEITFKGETSRQSSKYFKQIGRNIRQDGYNYILTDTLSIFVVNDEILFSCPWGPNSSLNVSNVDDVFNNNKYFYASLKSNYKKANIRLYGSMDAKIVGVMDSVSTYLVEAYQEEQPSWLHVYWLENENLQEGYVSSNLLEITKEYDDYSPSLLETILIILGIGFGIAFIIGYKGGLSLLIGGCLCMVITIIAITIIVIFFAWESFEQLIFDWFIINLSG